MNREQMDMQFIRKLPIPKEIKEEFPVSEHALAVKAARDQEIKDVFTGKSDKFLLIIGPCSADSEEPVMEYIYRLARLQEEVADRLIMILSIIGVSAPSFWFAIILQIFLGLKLGLFPISGFSGPMNYVLPSIALGTRYAGSIARITRTSMLEVLNQDYIRTARAKGVKNHLVILSHALKNALIPIVTLLGTDFGYMLTGSMLIEKVFSIPGIGKLAVDSMSNRDLPLLEGTVMYIAFVFVIVNLIVDISYAFLDPRIRIGKGAS